mgnify:CR=1 FL=1
MYPISIRERTDSMNHMILARIHSLCRWVSESLQLEVRQTISDSCHFSSAGAYCWGTEQLPLAVPNICGLFRAPLSVLFMVAAGYCYFQLTQFVTGKLWELAAGKRYSMVRDAVVRYTISVLHSNEDLDASGDNTHRFLEQISRARPPAPGTWQSNRTTEH